MTASSSLTASSATGSDRKGFSTPISRRRAHTLGWSRGATWPASLRSCSRKMGLERRTRDRRLARDTEHEPVHPLAHVAEVSLVAAFELGCGGARVADFSQGFADFGPVDVSVAEVHPLVAVFEALEILQVQLDDPPAERANPVLGIAI